MENTTLRGEHSDIDQVFIEFWLRAKNNSTFWILDGPLNAIICITVIILNILFLIVLQRKEMRSVTSFVLSAIAVADLLRTLISLPVSLYICVPYFKSYTPYHWCVYLKMPFLLVSNVFYTSSVWLTLYLGVFRYILVCHPIKAKLWCRYKIAIGVVILIFVISLFSYVCLLFMRKITRVVFWNEEEKRSVSSCFVDVVDTWHNYIFIQTILEIIFVQIIPCVGMLFITCKLVYTLKSAARSRKAMSRQLNRSRNESHQTTLLLIAILIAFLVFEIPHSVLQVFIILMINLHRYHFLLSYLRLFDTILIQILYITSTFNFCIYCTMGTKFRLTLKKIMSFN
ncbi:sex peptide receptor-like [Patella vulgata]|uniref:sex peptide receptor-like n=1 Tax=Patella vulgata TaxID=6465 RepID=UPI0024A9D145|nr:sex peptide receptor-like [Patella vulgata]